jgi:hypothetical protein
MSEPTTNRDSPSEPETGNQYVRRHVRDAMPNTGQNPPGILTEVTRPTARVLALLELLQSGGTHTVPTFTARLGVNERTLRRYAQHLTDLRIPHRFAGATAATGWPPPTNSRPDAGRRRGVAVMLGPIVPDRTWNGADAATVPYA